MYVDNSKQFKAISLLNAYLLVIVLHKSARKMNILKKKKKFKQISHLMLCTVHGFVLLCFDWY